MAGLSDPSYFGREQSLIKHVILDKYLERFAVIVGKGFDGIVYIDGFSGPWNVQSDKLEDASFSIALNQLRRARATVQDRFKRHIKIKCIFLEKKAESYIRLKKFAEDQRDVDVTALNLDFEQAIPELLKAIKGAGAGFFPFIFIDPTGWKGFSMDLIAPLLQIQPSEVLINFMTGFILRFAEDPRAGIDASFQQQFGDGTFREKLKGLTGRDREDALVFEYARRIARFGNFNYTPVTIVPHPTNDRTHFHLVYATRSLLGIEVFKDAEKHALNLVGEVRADAKRRSRESKTQQPEFFSGSDLPETAYLDELLAHYCSIARSRVHELIRSRRDLPFDEVFGVGMCFPLVGIKDLRAWIFEIADFVGLRPNERVAKINCGHRVCVRVTESKPTSFELQ